MVDSAKEEGEAPAADQELVHAQKEEEAPGSVVHREEVFQSARAEEKPVAAAAHPEEVPNVKSPQKPSEGRDLNASLDLQHDPLAAPGASDLEPEGKNEEPAEEGTPVGKPRRVMHRKEETLVTMLELLSGNKNNVEVNENAITEQKEKVEHIISELQNKMQQMTLEEPQPPSGGEQEDLAAVPLAAVDEDQRKSTLKMIERDIVGQFDLTLGKINGGIANLYCPEKLQIVQIPTCFIPRGTKAGNIVTISIARKKAEEEVRSKTILEIQEALNKYGHDKGK